MRGCAKGEKTLGREYMERHPRPRFSLRIDDSDRVDSRTSPFLASGSTIPKIPNREARLDGRRSDEQEVDGGADRLEGGSELLGFDDTLIFMTR